MIFDSFFCKRIKTPYAFIFKVNTIWYFLSKKIVDLKITSSHHHYVISYRTSYFLKNPLLGHKILYSTMEDSLVLNINYAEDLENHSKSVHPLINFWFNDENNFWLNELLYDTSYSKILNQSNYVYKMARGSQGMPSWNEVSCRLFSVLKK